ncbi:MAG: hypothetical protein QOG41_5 [Thermoleophilaceae bacterium]|nr:hypothetical protein [Thermoleophilaceae bacterium]
MTATRARRELEVDAAVLAIAAGLIHAVAAVGHVAEFWLFGGFFAVLAAAQVSWGALVYRGAGPRLLAAGAWGSAAVALLWLVSRTSGLPIGPHAGSPEAVGPLDVLATLDEQVTVAIVVGLLRFPQLRPSVIRAAARVGPVVGIALAMASLVSLTLGVHAH